MCGATSGASDISVGRAGTEMKLDKNWDAWDDEEDDLSLYYNPESDCPRCKGSGQTAFLSGIEWDYVGPDWGECPKCHGSGRL